MAKKEKKTATSSGKELATSVDPTINERRARVAELKARGRTNEAIALILAEEGFKTPDGKPFSANTISHDLQLVNKYWLDKSRDTIEMRRAEQLRDLELLKVDAWAHGEYQAAINAIKLKMELLGLKQKQEIQSGPTFNFKDIKGPLAIQQISDRVNKILDTGRARRAKLFDTDGSGVEAPAEAAESVRVES